MNGLIIRSPWIEMVLDEKKVWEIRGHGTDVRGKIGLIRGGSGLVVGTCDLVDVAGPLTLQQLRENARKAGVFPSQVNELPYKKTCAWILQNARRLPRPIPYEHPAGTAIWVRL